MTSPHFRCFVIGSDTLLAECTDHLLTAGHEVLGVVTDTPRLADYARERNLPVVDPADMSEVMEAQPFDHLFAITWLRILPEAVLALPRGRAVNFHDGPLPEWAGLNAPAWGLLNRVSTWAVTWHEMTAGVDEGDVLLRTPVPLAPDETSLSLNMKCFAAARDGFPTLVDDLAHDRLRPEPQPDTGRRVFGRHDRPDAAGLLDWTRPAADLEARVRALDFGPYANPLARALLLDTAGIGWIVTSARARVDAGATGSDPAPGTVVALEGGGTAVVTGEGLLEVTGLSDLRGRAVEPGSGGPALQPGSTLLRLPREDTTALTAFVAGSARHETFWARRLADLEPSLLPDLEAGVGSPDPGPDGRVRIEFAPPSVTDAADGEELLVAAWAVVVARLGRRPDVQLGWFEDAEGLPPAARPLVTPWRPLRLRLEPDTSFGDVVAAARDEIGLLRERGPFLTDLISRRPELATGPAGSAEPFPIAVRVGPARDPADSRLTDADPPVVLEIDPDGGGAALVVDRHRMPVPTAQAVAGGLEVLLGHAADGAPTPWTALPLVDAEARRLFDERNATDAPVDEVLVHRGFEARARTEPDRVALRFGGEALTYGDLDRRAEALARRLRGLGVGPGVVVGVFVERSVELMVATLGVLKAGGAYLPLDPDFPVDRIAFMLGDAGVDVVVTRGPGRQPALTDGIQVVDVAAVDEPDPEGREADPGDDGATAGPSDLAYVIYTSGSTGRPKGVLVEHRNVTNFFTGMDAVIRHDPPGVWLAVTSLSFDISVLELFWTLARGFEVVIHRDRERPAGDLRPAPTRARLDRRGMQFGLFMWGNDDGPGRDKYRLMLEAGRYFDEHGFDSAWTPERHFHAFGGPFPNPSVTGAALAAITRRLAIRSGSCVSPLHHPIRIAEEWAVVDNLSDGRVGLAFAAGWQPNDFVLRPESYPDQKAVMMEQIDTVRRLWRGEAVEFTNPLGDTVALTTLPRPVQAELPFWITTAGNPDTYRLAGRMGANVLTHLLGQTLDEVAEKIAAYREARAQAGLDPEGGTVTLMLHTFVGTDDDAVREMVREPMKDYLRASMKLVLGFAWTFPAFKRPGGPDSAPEDVDLSTLSDEESEAILDFAFDRYYETSGLFGTADTCVDMVARCASVGVDEIACLLDFGVDTDAVMAGLPHLKTVRDRANAAFDRRRSAGAGLREGEPATDEAAGAEDDARGPGGIAADDLPVDFGAAALIRRHGVTHLQCTPSMARLLLDRPDVDDAFAGLDHLMVGGEALPESLARELTEVVGGRVTNMYGPTETTIWSTTHEVTGDGPVPIGRPIANTRIHLLDPWGGAVPDGLPGDLWIGGRGVVRGYHGRPDLTAARFVADPFAAAPADGEPPRMYHTGDLARWRPDGVLDFLGRVDHQVKVRGYRIEPGEIEAALEALAGVAQATVALREDTPGDQRLVAYVVTDEAVAIDDLRPALGRDLPAYMVPSHFVRLDRMPLTPNGKIDRAALPAPDGVAGRSGPVVAPENDLEATLVEAWKEVLGLDAIGTEDNFFDAGGHSLLVVQLHRVLAQRIEQPLSLVDLYRFPTIRALAGHLSESESADEALDASAARGARRREMLRRRRGG